MTKTKTRVVRLNGTEYNDLIKSGWIEWDNDGRSAIMVLNDFTVVS